MAKIKKEKTPLDYGFVTFEKIDSKWTYRLTKDFTGSNLCFCVYNPIYSEPVFQKEFMKKIVERMNCREGSPDFISEKMLEIRGRRSWLQETDGEYADLRSIRRDYLGWDGNGWEGQYKDRKPIL